MEFYQRLQRMTEEERKAVLGAFAFGCGAELPSGVHISLDYLRRMTGLPKAEILEIFRNVGSLGIHAIKRNAVHEPTQGEIVGDDEDLLIWFRSQSDQSTETATRMTLLATDHYCADHGLDMVVRLDFSRLSSLTPPEAIG
ncbi:hypothetical protein [Micromonospora sp. DT231]|uniref:hypothetical protein n=1 Tax=Micromonospora sp. DT231 TaxID=3416526 RepID=UPI003CF05029